MRDQVLTALDRTGLLLTQDPRTAACSRPPREGRRTQTRGRVMVAADNSLEFTRMMPPDRSEDRWDRPYWSPGGDDAFLFYVVYGDVDTNAAFDRLRYRTRGLPEGLDVRLLTRSEDGEYIEAFEEGYVWDHLVANNPRLANDVKQSPACLILQGTVADPPSLHYLRDAVGVITFFLDHGGRSVYDIQIMKWWSSSEWRDDIFDPDDPAPSRQTLLMYSKDDDGGPDTWVHTRGMRKFGRPDISVRDVHPQQFDVVVDLCNRLIAYQAYGALISEGETVRLAGMEGIGVIHHAGDPDDDDFNNFHFEVEWHPR